MTAYFSRTIQKGYRVAHSFVEIGVKTRQSSDVCTEETLKRKSAKVKTKIYDIAIMNDWKYFVTLTFDPEKVNSYDYEEVSRKLSKWLNNMKSRDNPKMRYIIVPELHASGRYHFHGLFSEIDDKQMIDSGKKDGKGRVIYNWGSYALGWSTATEIGNAEHSVKYMTKYVTKDLKASTKNKRMYWSSKGLEKPQVVEMQLDKHVQIQLQKHDNAKTTSRQVVDVENYMRVYITHSLLD